MGCHHTVALLNRFTPEDKEAIHSVVAAVGIVMGIEVRIMERIPRAEVMVETKD